MSKHPSRYHIQRQTNAGPNHGKWRVHTPTGGFSVGPACESRKQALWLAGVLEYAEKHCREKDPRSPSVCFEGYFDRCKAGAAESGPLFPRKDGKLL